jgi:hypothetical protein
LERFDSNPLAKARQSFDAHLRYRKGPYRLAASLRAARDLAYRVERNTYTESTLDAYERQILLNEAYGNWSTSHFDIVLGKQIVAWGQGDVLSPIDVVNPRDTREPGLADPIDARLGVWASRAGAQFGVHRVELIAIHRADFGLRSPVFGPFNPLQVLFANAADPAVVIDDVRYVDQPQGFELASQQYLGRWSFAGPGVDLALYAASALDQFGVLSALEFSVTRPNTLNLVVEHPRYTLLAHSGSAASGPWLFKWEVAGFFGRSFDLEPEATQALELEQRSVTELSAMVGLTHSGISGTTLTLEATDGAVLQNVGPLLFPHNRPAVALRTHHRFLHDDLTLDALFLGIGAWLEWGFLTRIEAAYALSDSLRAGLGYITYQPGDEFGFYSGFVRHDRVMMNLRYDFSLD